MEIQSVQYAALAFDDGADQLAPFSVVAMAIFSVLTTYMLFAAAYTIVHAAQTGSSELTVIIFSLIATYGCYVLSSLLALDPWHLSKLRYTPKRFIGLIMILKSLACRK